MARINLLPWRTERRKQRQREFYGMLGLSAALAVLVSWSIVSYYSAEIEGQGARNAYLQQQIQQVDAQIKEIEALDQKRAKLLARKEVIEQLQAGRSQMVHLFDELVRTIPDGVRLTSIQQAGNLLTLEGRAQSNARVSSYMRNIEASGWMTNPEPVIIEARGDDRNLPFAFTLKLQLAKPKADGSEGAQATEAQS